MFMKVACYAQLVEENWEQMHAYVIKPTNIACLCTKGAINYVYCYIEFELAIYNNTCTHHYINYIINLIMPYLQSHDRFKMSEESPLLSRSSSPLVEAQSHSSRAQKVSSDTLHSLPQP